MSPLERFAHHRDAVRARLAGSGHVRPGPGSVTWKINREIVVVAGWGRAILLQLAHPSLAAGVHAHSQFRGSLWSGFSRLHSTVSAMLSITFGDDEQMVPAAAGINTIHDRVRGYVDGGHQTYSAHDPDLQRWVHVTLVQSMPLVYESLVGPLSAEEKDRYCAEAAIMEPLLGMPEGWLPCQSAQLDAYVADMLAAGELDVTDTSRALARAILYPPHWYLCWPVFRAMQLLTIGSLPSTIRQAYGLTWSERDQRSFARWTAFIRGTRRLLPRFAREWPRARRNSLVTRDLSPRDRERPSPAAAGRWG